MHFCTLVARGNGAGTTPVKYGMNGTMPATVNSSAGSSLTSEAEGTTVCPRSPKKVSQRRWISAVCTAVPWSVEKVGMDARGRPGRRRYLRKSPAALRSSASRAL